MGFSFNNFSNWGNISGQQVSQSGPSAKNTDGNSYSTQTGDANSLQWGNKNSFQHGVSNSVLLGMSFSTNVAGTFSTTAGFSFSTTVGAAFSMQGALSVAGFIGPKFSVNRSWELSASWADKYTWIKDEKEFELKEGKFTAVDKEAKFRKDATSYIGTEVKTIKSGKKNVLEASYTLGKRTTTVGMSDTTKITGAHSLSAAKHNIASTLGGEVLVASVVKLSGLKVVVTAPMINLG